MNDKVSAPTRFWIRIISGEHTGRFVGMRISGVVTKPNLHSDPPRPMDGTEFSSYGHETPLKYREARAQEWQAILKKAGYETELVEVPSTWP
jgi:hypothetical protein